MDSPSVEAGALGHDALKETIEASEEKLAKKMNDGEGKKERDK